ncbi:recombination-associated protein RdgC [Atlantibacter sp.]|uniref:recombination-associated protein RdgC n=1 Tax=Atlantibacter sp. TaxID=1903473 RepID=UPI0028A2CC7B|nr:recombination-associated protein RdgC [Atlantibacter sp.]
MKTFRTAFPYVMDKDLPDNLEDLIANRGFDGLTDTARQGHGWSQVANDSRLLFVDGKYLLRYLSCQRKPDAVAVARLVNERIDQATEAGREVSLDLKREMEVQAENELLKYAAVSSNSVYLLLWPAQRLLIASGGTVRKCEDALSYLRKTLDTLAVAPWGDLIRLAEVITEHMTADETVYSLPANLSISTFGKTIFTGSDSSLKVVLDGVQNDTDDAKSMLAGMSARAIEMSLVRRPDNGQIDNLANFTLQMPQSGNIHFKKYDYDDDVVREDIAQELISEMHLVCSYTQEILSALQVFMGVKSEEPATA